MRMHSAERQVKSMEQV